MKEERIYRVGKAGEEIKELVANNKTREAWRKIKRWYQEVNSCQAHPTREGMEQNSTLQEDIYRRRPPEGEPIPILLQMLSIVDGTPEGGEIAASVHKLRAGRAGGPSGMNVEHLKTWLREETREKDPDTKKWDKLASILQVAFRYGYIPEELTWMTMVLIPKGGGGYRGIVLF